ncbi:ATP synthase F1 subunit epsilon [Mycoplasma sp. P36-A1]|uniref:ATP synthase F1 subunit epsilon n=1 Tax=Mycoplasma sp. P36-A1 TaxID=3252900 RepID=UPI003C2DF1E1
MFTLVISEAERKQFEGRAKIVNVPTSNGMVGILTNHAPMVDKINDGILTYEDENGERFEMTVSSGYLFVWNNLVTIFVNSAENISDIDLERVLAEIEASKKTIETASTSFEIKQAEVKLGKNLNRKNAYEQFRN